MKKIESIGVIFLLIFSIACQGQKLENTKTETFSVTDSDKFFFLLDNYFDLNTIQPCYSNPTKETVVANKHVLSEKDTIKAYDDSKNYFSFYISKSNILLQTCAIINNDVLKNDIKIGMTRNDFNTFLGITSNADNIILQDFERSGKFAFIFKNGLLFGISYKLKYLD